MFPSEVPHSVKYQIHEFESENTEGSYSSLNKPRDSFFNPKETTFCTPPHPRDSTFFSKTESTICSKDTCFYSRDSFSFSKDLRRKGYLCKDEENFEPAFTKKLFLEDPSEKYRAKTTSFIDRKGESTRENNWTVGNNTINFTNVNSLAHFQRKSPLMNVKYQSFEDARVHEKFEEDEYEDEMGKGKNTRGLKNLSIRVREFVIRHKETTYKEIAEQLLIEMKKVKPGIENTREEQNIKRRIYDALNVLVATEIFKKKGKTVFYDGKSNVMGHELMNKRALFDKEDLLSKIKMKKEILQTKQKSLQSILLKNLAIKNLLNRNYEKSRKGIESTEKFEFPFLLLPMNSISMTLRMNKPKSKLGIFSKAPLNVLGDMDVLIKLKMHKVERNMIEKWFPKDVIHYLPENSDDEL